MNQPRQKNKEKFYARPGNKRNITKKDVTIKSVTKHLKNETKKKDDKKTTAAGAAKKPEVEDPIEKKLKTFTKFYQTIALVPEAEWKTFQKENVGTQFLSFRFLSNHSVCPSFPDTVPGIPSQRDVLIDFMKKKFVEPINKMVVDNRKQLSLTPFTWYPNDWGWTMNIDQVSMGKYLGLKDFYFFLNSLKNETRIQNLEIWSMLPSLLLRIQPHHKVLDMCASPGFIAGQISEVMHADPNITNEGVLVLNDWWKFNDKMQYRWCQGPKAVFTNEDARTYPDLYISEKKDPLRFDRIICDVRCSNDGTMRKNVGLQDTWSSQTALEYHKDQLSILKRGLELIVPGGLVLYSTTSMNPIENEGVVMGMLKEAAGTVDLVDVSRIVYNFKLRPGMTKWQDLVHLDSYTCYVVIAPNPPSIHFHKRSQLRRPQVPMARISDSGNHKVMSEEGFFFPNYKMTPDEFQKKYPESVFPPPQKEAMAFHMERCARVLPHDNSSAGFFCALLVKNKELPWIIEAKKAAEAEARAARLAQAANAKSSKSQAAPPPKTPEKKKYGYKIELKPQIALMEIEWTVENTNRFLQTKTKVEKQKFPLPDLEVNESCLPRKLVELPDLKEVDEAFGYCNPEDEDWLKIKTFFKISDNFDPRVLLTREDKHFWFMSSLFVRNLVKHNRKRLDFNILPDVGVKILHQMRDLWINCDTTCQYIFTEEGFAAMYPYIGKQLVKVTKDDILALAYHEKVKITDLSEMAQADIKDTEQGCILFIYKPKDFSAVPKCNVTFVGARGENYITDFKEGKTSERKAFFRLCGMEQEDYRRKIQEEKLARVMEMERQKKNKEAMDTS